MKSIRFLLLALALGSANAHAAQAIRDLTLQGTSTLAGGATLNLSGGTVTMPTAFAMPTAVGNTGLSLVSNGSAWIPTAAGSGDVTSNTATAVDGEFALFNGTTGKSLKRGLKPSPNMLTLLGSADFAAARGHLGLGSAALQDVAAFEVPLTFNGGLSRSTNTVSVVNATTSTPGKIEVATEAESLAGTDATRANTPAGVRAVVHAAPFITRHYDTQVTVATTIKAALAAISDASATKRYLLYVPDGTYSEDNPIVPKSYVDIVGQSQLGVIINPANSGEHTIAVGAPGLQFMLANVTVNHSGAKYAIHHDAQPSDALRPTSSAETLYYNVTATSNTSSAFGIGQFANQRLFLINVTATSTTDRGIWAHNAASAQTARSELHLINVTATGSTWGMDFGSSGSGKPDFVNILGGAFTGGTGGLRFRNNPDASGAGEAFINIDPSTSGTVTVSAGTRIYLPPFVPVIRQTDPNLPEYAGTIYPSAVIVAGGDVTLDNTKALKIKDSGGTARTVLTLDAGDNAFLKAASGGDVYIGPLSTNNARIRADGRLTLGGTTAATAGHLMTDLSGNLDVLGDITAGSGNVQITNAGMLRDAAIESTIARDSEVNTAIAGAFSALTDGATITITCSASVVEQNRTVTLGGNRTLAISGAASGMRGVLIVTQDGTGSRTLALPAGSKVIGGGAGAITLTTTAAAIDVLSWYYNGTNYFWTYGANFN